MLSSVQIDGASISAVTGTFTTLIDIGAESISISKSNFTGINIEGTISGRGPVILEHLNFLEAVQPSLSISECIFQDIDYTASDTHSSITGGLTFIQNEVPYDISVQSCKFSNVSAHSGNPDAKIAISLQTVSEGGVTLLDINLKITDSELSNSFAQEGS